MRNAMWKQCKISISSLLKISYLHVSLQNFSILRDLSMNSMRKDMKMYVCYVCEHSKFFKDFWGQWDTSRKLECLQLLNEIICEFDKLLSKPKFSSIEKIKTVASTYIWPLRVSTNKNHLTIVISSMREIGVRRRKQITLHIVMRQLWLNLRPQCVRFSISSTPIHSRISNSALV
uniref:adenylate cyclase n=1 Tax=Ascaris suum TaxID=6253 RepID=F1LE83_ASCSU